MEVKEIIKEMVEMVAMEAGVDLAEMEDYFLVEEMLEAVEMQEVEEMEASKVMEEKGLMVARVDLEVRAHGTVNDLH